LGNIKTSFGLFLVLVCLSFLLVACNSQPSPTLPPTPTLPESGRKVDSILLDLLAQYRLNGAEAAKQFARDRGLLDEQDNVLFSLVMDQTDRINPVSDKIRQMGGTVRGVYGNLISVGVPLQVLVGYVTSDEKRADFFNDLSAFRGVREIRLNPPPGNKP
jgi:hypothetical protein